MGIVCTIFYRHCLGTIGIVLVFVVINLNHCNGDPKSPPHAKLILYQGSARHEIDGKTCPVGISFVKPEKFSCACVTGM